MMLKHKLVVVSFILTISIVFAVLRIKSAQATIVLDPTTKYQTMIGWEATAQAGQLACDSADFIQGNLVMCPAFKNIRDAVFNTLVDDLGISRLRVEIYPGVENSTDYFAQYLNGQISEHDWVHVYGVQIINDNNDPNVINPAGFHFTSFDYKIDTAVLPIKQLLEARGEKLFLMLATLISIKTFQIITTMIILMSMLSSCWLPTNICKANTVSFLIPGS